MERLSKTIPKAMMLDSKNSKVYLNRAISYHYLKKYEAAIADFSKAISFNPGLTEAYFGRGVFKPTNW